VIIACHLRKAQGQLPSSKAAVASGRERPILGLVRMHYTVARKFSSRSRASVLRRWRGGWDGRTSGRRVCRIVPEADQNLRANVEMQRSCGANVEP
jgi:hypothetical protein